MILLALEDGEEVQGGRLSVETHATDVNWSNPGSRLYSTPIVQVLIVIAGLAPAFFVDQWKPRFPRRLWGALQLLLISDLPLAQDEHWTRRWNGGGVARQVLCGNRGGMQWLTPQRPCCKGDPPSRPHPNMSMTTTYIKRDGRVSSD